MVLIIPTISSKSMHAARCLERKDLSAGARKRRFAAKLRKLRWHIYQRIKFKKRRVQRLFDYYKKQVELYLLSSNLKAFEVGIWKRKLSTTQNDVKKYLHDEKKTKAIAVDTLRKPQVSDDCSRKLDSVLDMLSTVLHLVNVTKDKSANSMQECSKVKNYVVLETHEPSVNAMKSVQAKADVVDKEATKAKVDDLKQRKLELKKKVKVSTTLDENERKVVSHLMDDLDLVKEKLYILMMPNEDEGKAKTDAVGELRRWLLGEI